MTPEEIKDVIGWLLQQGATSVRVGDVHASFQAKHVDPRMARHALTEGEAADLTEEQLAEKKRAFEEQLMFGSA